MPKDLPRLVLNENVGKMAWCMILALFCPSPNEKIPGRKPGFMRGIWYMHQTGVKSVQSTLSDLLTTSAMHAFPAQVRSVDSF